MAFSFYPVKSCKKLLKAGTFLIASHNLSGTMAATDGYKQLLAFFTHVPEPMLLSLLREQVLLKGQRVTRTRQLKFHSLKIMIFMKTDDSRQHMTGNGHEKSL